MIEDSYRHRGLRRALVRQLRQQGITDEDVLAAIGRVPRHAFFEPIFLEHAYQDKAFPIGEGQTISQPYTVAWQTTLLGAAADHRVLEIGTGSGYQACVLLELGARVFSVETVPALHRRACHQLNQMGYRPALHCADGTEGWPVHAPYDRILVTAGAPAVPPALLDQLTVGGVMIIPVGPRSQQQMVRLTKVAARKVRRETFGTFSFVPLVGRDGW